MCEGCGCSLCDKCGRPIENGVCSGCKMDQNDCTCQPESETE